MAGFIDKLIDLRNRKFGTQSSVSPAGSPHPHAPQNAEPAGTNDPVLDDNVTDITSDMGRMPLSRKILTALITAAIVLGFTYAMIIIVRLNDVPEERTRGFNTFAVQVDIAKRQDVQLYVDTQGEARPQIEIDLVPEVGGKIIYVSPNFIDGGIFKKGEVLIRIEDADYNANVIRAQSAVAQAEQVLVREQAEADIARQDFAELGTGTPSALALREPQRQEAEASLSAAKAQLDTARLQFERTAVRAPFAGRVRSKDADIGQYVNPGARLGRVFSANITEVRLALSNDDLSKLDLPVAFVASSREDAPDVVLSAQVGGEVRTWNGKIMRTDSTFDTQTRGLFAIVEVFDPYNTGATEDGVPLAPGLFVNATITGKVLENVVTFKRDGLRPSDEVYLVDETGKGSIRSVEVIDTNEQIAILASGVEAGELVVLSPMERSRISIPLQALDANDPSITLVMPKDPAAGRPTVVAEPKSLLQRMFPKDEDPDKLSRSQQDDLLSALSSEYAQVMRQMTDAEESAYRKMNDQEKGQFLKAKMASQANTGGRGVDQTSGPRGP